MIRKVLNIAALLLILLSPPAHSDDLKFGIYPSNDPARLIVPMKILAGYLEEKTGDSFSVIVTKDYQELSDRIRNRTIGIAWINPVNYVKIKSENPSLKYIATYMEKKKETGEIIPYYQSFIISLKNSGIAAAENARGKRFAFTDPGSTSGYSYPRMMLRDKGIDPDTFFMKVFFLKRHDRVIEALVKGSIDLGAVSDGTYYAAVGKYGDIFNIMLRSEPIPLDAVVAVDTIPDEKVSLYREALISIGSEHSFNLSMRKNLEWNAAGFMEKDDSFYDSLRRAMDMDTGRF